MNGVQKCSDLTAMDFKLTLGESVFMYGQTYSLGGENFLGSGQRAHKTKKSYELVGSGTLKWVLPQNTH